MITVVIPSMNPPLCEQARALLPKDWPVLVVNGDNAHAQMVDMLSPRQSYQTRWLLRLDEDCFLIHPERIVTLTQHMEANNLHFAGPRDGGEVAIRSFHPLMMNAFFTLFDLHHCQQEYPTVPNIQTRLHNIYDRQPFSSPEYKEAYYHVYLYLLMQGRRPLYLPANDLDPSFHPPSVVHDHLGNPIAVHAWHSRCYPEERYMVRHRACLAYLAQQRKQS